MKISPHSSRQKEKHKLIPPFYSLLIGLLLTTFLWIGESVFVPRIPLPGETAEFYSTETHDDLQLTFEKAIGNAQESVLVFIYTLNDNRIIKALRNKAEEKVDVTIICDAEASKGIHRRLGPQAKIFLRKSKGLMHQKILVVDNRKVWIGSANLTTPSLKMHGNLVAGLDSTELAGMIREKAEAMTTSGLVKYFPERAFRIGGQPVEMSFFPDAPQGVEKIKELIKTAEKTIKVAMFTWTRFDLAKEISDARERGVAVEVVVDRNSAAGTSKKIVNYLFELGLPVRLSSGNGLLHHKLMIVDEKAVLCGSANWTYSAFTKNDDCYLIIYDINEKQNELLTRMWHKLVLDSEEFIP
jgi:cardiolipin synthase A/B